MKTKISTLPYFSRERLSKILTNINGKKDLIIDGNMIKCLENIMRTSKLRTFDVEKLYKMSDLVPCTNNVRVFLTFTNLETVKLVCNHVNAEISKNSNNTNVKFYLIIVPRKLNNVMRLIEEEGVFDYIKVISYTWELISLNDKSVFSLEMPQFITDLIVNGDQSLLPIAANSIWSSLLICGNPSVCISIGNNAQIVNQMVNKFSTELCSFDHCKSNIDYCIIVDRDVDFISTLLTPTTYTSLLDEAFGIKSNFVQLVEGLVISLNNHDIYSQVKDRHFAHVIPFLKEQTKRIQVEYEASQKMQIRDMKNYVQKNLMGLVEQKKSLSQHISACEMIMKKMGSYFEQLVSTEESILTNTDRNEVIKFIENSLSLLTIDKFAVVRLMCLLSIMQNGLNINDANLLKTQFLNAYGLQFLPMFHNLEKMGLFVPLQSASRIADKVAQVVPLPSRKTGLHQMIQKLKLIPPTSDNTANMKDPSDMSYVFSGTYTPAICQLIQLLHNGEMAKDDIPKYFSNSKVETFRPLVSSGNGSSFYVYFIGGVTYSEVAAFQLFEKLSGCQVAIAATNIINGNSICQACVS